MKKICVLGLGYIGLPTALLFAQHFQILGVDINTSIVSSLKKGNLPFEEQGLSELYERVEKNFFPSDKVEESDAFIIAVPTPLNESLKTAELKYVRSAAEMVSKYLNSDNLVVLESTVPPGTSEHLAIPTLLKNGLTENEIHFAHCPERAIPGNTLDEIINNDRIIGANSHQAAMMGQDLYSSFVEGKIHLTDLRTAEFVKLMENTYRDVNIALANEFAQMGQEVGINIWEAIDLANLHPRVNILRPGPGVGGHCIAIDPWFLTESSTTTRLINLARTINESMPNVVMNGIRPLLQDIKKPVITILGVAYKGNVDDWRETPALKLIKLAENEGYTVKIHDPHVKTFPYPIIDLHNALENSDCIILVTDHVSFKSIDPTKISMKTKILFDTRNTLDHKKWQDSGFKVKILGNGNKTFLK